VGDGARKTSVRADVKKVLEVNRKRGTAKKTSVWGASLEGGEKEASLGVTPKGGTNSKQRNRRDHQQSATQEGREGPCRKKKGKKTICTHGKALGGGWKTSTKNAVSGNAGWLLSFSITCQRKKGGQKGKNKMWGGGKLLS